jgi:hypothetical protein
VCMAHRRRRSCFRTCLSLLSTYPTGLIVAPAPVSAEAREAATKDASKDAASVTSTPSSAAKEKDKDDKEKDRTADAPKEDGVAAAAAEKTEADSKTSAAGAAAPPVEEVRGRCWGRFECDTGAPSRSPGRTCCP